METIGCFRVFAGDEHFTIGSALLLDYAASGAVDVKVSDAILMEPSAVSKASKRCICS